MAQKWNLQDIRPASAPKQPVRESIEKRTHQDISPRVQKVAPVVHEAFDDSDLESIEVLDGNGVKRKRVVVTGIVSVIIIASAVIVNIFLGGAVVTVHPKIKDTAVQSNILAFTEPQADELGYELLSLEETGERQVKASGKEPVSLRTEGKIFVYNTKSTSVQRLIKNTRFEDKNGLIFRIKESIDVPGATKNAQGELVPGSVVAEVFADSTGEKYNIPPSKFTVPGLKGSDQFDSVYGESTTAFTGGYEGEKFIIDEQELNTAQQSLQMELRDKLIARLATEKPAGFVVFNDAVTFAYETLPSTEYGESLATIKQKARLNIPLFKESEFAKYLANLTIPDYAGESVTIPNPLSLTFLYTNATTSVSDISMSKSIDITLKGTTRIVWTFDEEKLKEALVSKKKSEATQILSDYRTSISSAQTELRPFWANSFPDSPRNITINTVLDN